MFRVHPLIMTLGMSLVVLGLANVWQLAIVKTGAGVPPTLRTLGSGTFLDVVPLSLLVFVPLAAIILFGLSRPATVASCTPSATTRSPPACRAPGPGRS